MRDLCASAWCYIDGTNASVGQTSLHVVALFRDEVLCGYLLLRGTTPLVNTAGRLTLNPTWVNFIASLKRIRYAGDECDLPILCFFANERATSTEGAAGSS